jgi:sugar (pentulose or hexulose) kinase
VIAPFVEPAARANFFGLARHHRRADMLRAIYEGIALAIRDCYSALKQPISTIILGGGGARSGLWPNIIADCLGAQVIIPHGREFGAKGAALLAGVGIGLFSDITTASRQTFHPQHTIAPDHSLTVAYDALYSDYRTVQTALRPAWKGVVGRRQIWKESDRR